MPHRLMDMFHLPTISALFGVMAATGVVIDEKSLVPVGTIGAVSCIVWWTGRKLQRIDDRIERMEEASKLFRERPCFKNPSVCPLVDDEKKPLKMM